MSRGSIVADTLQSAIEAIKAGNRAAGQQLLVQYLKANPNSEAAWLWMAITFDEADKKRKCLNTALEINPNSQAARQ